MPVIDLSKPLDDPERVRDYTEQELLDIEADRLAQLELPPTARPIAIASALITVSVTGGIASISNFSGTGFSSAARIGVGRIRVFFEPAQSDTNYFPTVTPIHNADVSARVNARTATYVEIKTNGSVEASGYAIQVARNPQ